ncbi:MAG: corrinoid protein-associated methyltransferase CpaM [Candidatus Hydrothermarchaeota archaeon]
MSTYILMKILESAPSRYDKGIRILTLGRLDKAYDRLASHIKKGQKVIDLGCGTGALTLRAAQKDAKVKGIDISPQMLAIAEKRASEAGLTQNIKFYEMGVAELGSEKSESYNVVVSGLCFSELSEDELIYALKEIKRILKLGGLLLVADEVRPKSLAKRMLNWLIRFPLVIITYLISQTSTKAVKNLPEKIKGAGLLTDSLRLNKMENFIELVARKPKGGEE